MGAPLTETERARRHLNIYIDREIIKESKIKALRADTSLSQVIEQLLTGWLKKK
jgi:predicted HicB family RNase H-like nuclease